MKKNLMIDIGIIWKNQENSANNEFVRERLDNPADINCFIGIVGSTKARIFQLEIKSEIEIHKNYLRKFRGVDIQVVPKENDLRDFTIILLEQDLSDVFTLFIEDIISNLNVINDLNIALQTINQRINYWRKMFARANGQTLSQERQRGLFGELYLLQLLLKKAENHFDVIHSWSGPDGSNQDFITDRTAIEVKTSSSNHPIINISNEEQLNYQNWNELFLFMIIVNEARGAYDTLFNSIQEVIGLLVKSPELVSTFEQKLKNVGIDPNEYEDYSEIGFSVRKCKCYQVVDGFPIVIRDHLISESVFNVKYQVDTASLESFQISEEMILDKFI